LDGRERYGEIEKGREIEARESEKKEDIRVMEGKTRKKWGKVSGRELQRDVVYLC
jgi:hypothetical protein